MDLRRFTLFTGCFILELFAFVELCEAIIKRCVVGLVINLVSLFSGRSMLNNFIWDRIVALWERLWVPFNCYETLLYEVFFKVRCICRHYYAATAFGSPVAEWANETCFVNSFEHEGCIDGPITFCSLAPVFLLPPAEGWSMEATRRFEQDMGTWPYLIVDTSATWKRSHGKDQWISDKLRYILLE